jgi:hypothetical protein
MTVEIYAGWLLLIVRLSVKVGDLIEARYNARGRVAIILEITPTFSRPFALVKFAHQPYLTRVFLNNFEVLSES